MGRHTSVQWIGKSGFNSHMVEPIKVTNAKRYDAMMMLMTMSISMLMFKSKSMFFPCSISVQMGANSAATNGRCLAPFCNRLKILDSKPNHVCTPFYPCHFPARLAAWSEKHQMTTKSGTSQAEKCTITISKKTQQFEEWKL